MEILNLEVYKLHFIKVKPYFPFYLLFIPMIHLLHSQYYHHDIICKDLYHQLITHFAGKTQFEVVTFFKFCRISNALCINLVSQIFISFCILAFKDKPLTPPSRAQEMVREGSAEDPEASVDYMASIKRLMTNKGYVLLLITYGLNVGVFYAISTLLNSVILMHFEVKSTYYSL